MKWNSKIFDRHYMDIIWTDTWRLKVKWESTKCVLDQYWHTQRKWEIAEVNAKASKTKRILRRTEMRMPKAIRGVSKG